MSTETVSDPVLPEPEDALELELTRTEQANTVAKVAPPRAGTFKKWWKRRPIRRFMVVIHRWPSRIIWLILGLTPLLLFVTSISTWLYRHGTKKRRRQARAARAFAATSASIATSEATTVGAAPDSSTNPSDPPSSSDEAIARQGHDRGPT